MTTPPPGGHNPASWYPDPFHRHELRYWDGIQWTQHVMSRGHQQTDPPVPSAPAPTTNPPGWHPDPFRRHESRYWDGHQWTHQVTSRGQQYIDPPIGSIPMTPAQGAAPSRPNSKIQRQVRRAGVANDQVGGGSLLTEPVLVVNQKPKMIEVNAEYAIYNQHGLQVGAVREIGQSMLKNAVVPGKPRSGRMRRLQIFDRGSGLLLTLTRPSTIARSTVYVRRPDGTEVGQIVQKNLGIIGKVRFALESRDHQLGSINAESWNAWDFSVQDAAGDEVARITKTLGGLVKHLSTKRDKYVVEIHRPAEEPLHSLAIAAALAIDTVLRQGHD